MCLTYVAMVYASLQNVCVSNIVFFAVYIHGFRIPKTTCNHTIHIDSRLFRIISLDPGWETTSERKMHSIIHIYIRTAVPAISEPVDELSVYTHGRLHNNPSIKIKNKKNNIKRYWNIFLSNPHPVNPYYHSVSFSSSITNIFCSHS